MIKRTLIFLFALLLLVACGGEFEDEYYDDEFYEDDPGFFEDDEFYDEEPITDEEYYEEEPITDEEYYDEEPVDNVAEEEAADDMVEQETASIAASSGGSFASANCPFSGADQFNIECGYLTVPENRRTGSSATIDLAIAILPATQGATDAPVIFLDGGPGGSALSSLESDPSEWTAYEYARTRDTVFIDQRGTGYSEPSLNCPEMDDDVGGIDNELDCLDRLLADGIDVTAYNTVENAADVADLAAALGFDSYNLYGVSYGTRLAMAVMRDHPQNIRSVVLDSPFPPNSDPATNEGPLSYDRFRALFDTCAQDPACNDYYPDLENVLLDTVVSMNNNPPNDYLDGDVLVETIYQALFAADDYASAVPLMIYLSSEKDYSFLEEISDELFGGYSSRWGVPSQSENDGDSEGMYTSVMCHDEYSLSSVGAAEDQLEAKVPEELWVGLAGGSQELFELCDAWGAGQATARADAAVVSDIPTLILAGEYDPATPPVWGELAAQTLENSFFYILRGGGHSLTTTNTCAIDLMNQFFANPSGGFNESCLDQQTNPQWE